MIVADLAAPYALEAALNGLVFINWLNVLRLLAVLGRWKKLCYFRALFMKLIVGTSLERLRVYGYKPECCKFFARTEGSRDALTGARLYCFFSGTKFKGCTT